MTTPSSSPSLSTGAYFLLITLLATLWFGTLHQRKLINPDEGRYAEIPREMVASGDWLTPRLNDIKYFEKPPLQYWTTAAAYTAFGQHEWTARLWSALCGFLGILATAFTVHRIWGKDAALYAASVLSSSLLWIMIGHLNTLDMGVSFFLSAAIFCFILAQQDASTASNTRRWMWLGWLMLALSILSKGLIGIALPAATLVGYSLWQRDFSIWRKLHLVSGLLLLLAVTAPWFIAVSLANPEFAHFFFIHEHFERFLTKTHDRYQPMWYFIPILLAGILPWLFSLFTMLGDALRKNPEQRFQPQRFLLVWCVVVFCFFSVSSSKLPSYILPLFPALAALIGLHLARLSAHHPHRLIWHAAPFIILGLAALYFAPEATRFSSARVPPSLYAGYIPWLRAAAICLIVGALLSVLFARVQKPRPAILSLTIGGLLMSLAILLGHDNLSPANSAAHIAAKIRDQVKPDVPFFSVNAYDQSLQFYLKRPTTMVFYKDELGFGITHEPQKFIADQQSFEHAWASAPEAWALLNPDTWQMFEKAGIPMQVVARDTRRVIVKKH